MEGLTTLPRDRSSAGLLARNRIVAAPGFNRWLVPPAALAIHLCIGMAYGLSVFWLPMTRLLGVTLPVACSPGTGLLQMLTATRCDWRVSDVSWTFIIAIVTLGSSAAIWGGWLERAGPRKAGVVAALFWCGGMMVAAAGVAVHQLWLLWLGLGVFGGIGLGIGYISPVSTLIKWFPDRRGMATGMAIMGFGGGALIGAPLADLLINAFRTPTSTGVAECLAVLSSVYLVFMLAGAFGYRVPPADWRPDDWEPRATKAKFMATWRNVHFKDAHKTLSFWMMWGALCLNVSAGIGVLALASPMLQEIFGGRLVGQPGTGFAALDGEQLRTVAAVAAGFVGLLSLFNIAGRFFWSSLSDRIGRKMTYGLMLELGVLLYACAPWAAHHGGSKLLFVGICCGIMTLYGGAFATIPAYLADIFGTQFVGAIHGRLLTAWSVAGLVGPVLVTYLRQEQLAAGVPQADVYDLMLYVLAGLLAVGYLLNTLVRPLADRWFMSEDQLDALHGGGGGIAAGPSGIGRGGMDVKAALAWAAVGLPIAWGVWLTLSTSAILLQ